MAITAAQVKQLRDVTGAGMMDCKKARNGDMDAAVEFLRKKGQAKAEKKANRIAAEGICYIAQDGDTKAAVVEVNSETDFVAQNEKFRTYVAKVAQQALNTAAEDIDAFMGEAWAEDTAKTVKDSRYDRCHQREAQHPQIQEDRRDRRLRSHLPSRPGQDRRYR